MASGSSFTRPNVDLEGLLGVEGLLDEGLLSDAEATIHFTDPNDLARTLRDFKLTRCRDIYDHTVLVTGFPIEILNINEDHTEASPLPRHRKILYLKNSKILILTMKGLPHEIAARHFAAKLHSKLEKMNCEDDIILGGGATVDLEGLTKEPDEMFGPYDADHMTCVLEAGYTESNRALHRDANEWLKNKESHITQVVLIKIFKGRTKILFSIIKKSREDQETKVDQDVYVTLEGGKPTTSGRLTLSFEGLFERRPRPGTQESDIEFSARDLTSIASPVWKKMGLIPEEKKLPC
jgi:hypothetical protein